MAKLKVDKWDAEFSIPVGDQKDASGLKLNEKVTVVIEGEVVGINLSEPHRKGLDKTGDIRIRARSVQVNEDLNEFELMTYQYDNEEECTSGRLVKV